MHFHSLDYLLFLLLAVCGYWLVAKQAVLRLLFLFVMSCAFYMAWHPTYIVLILGSCLLDYTVGLALGVVHRSGLRKFLLSLSLFGNLSLLGVFKYFNFFAEAVGDGLGLCGIQVAVPHLEVLLPVGISFYTFQTLSYTIDVYRGRLEPTRNFLRFAVFVTFFPQLVAGPIVRASDLLPQLALQPVLSTDRVGRALFSIVTGLVKKVALADFVALNLVDRVFAEPAAYSSAEVLMALYGYTLQIYCDFSGYTDVARGSAMLMGLDLPENFDRPYQAQNPAEFWRRWHMTLSSWLRDYLYFPLGGSRAAPARAYFNLFTTMFLIGLWHGADWNFVVYGTIQGGAVVLHRMWVRRFGRPAEQTTLAVRVLKVLGTLHFVVLSRIFFRGADFGNSVAMFERLFDGSSGLGHLPQQGLVVLLIGMAAHYTPKRWWLSIEGLFVRLPAPGQAVVLAAVGAALMLVVSHEVVPYIYFQF